MVASLALGVSEAVERLSLAVGRSDLVEKLHDCDGGALAEDESATDQRQCSPHGEHHSAQAKVKIRERRCDGG